MNLALHQTRIEFRRSWWGFLLYLLVLGCNYAVVAGWIGRPSLSTDGQWGYNGPFTTLLIFAYWLGFAMMTAASVAADSPARAERFLATRPLPTISLAAGKVLYLLLAVVLPAVLLECLSVATVTADASRIALAGVERFLLCGVIAFAIAAFAAHWKNVQGFFLASVISFAAIMILGRLGVALFLGLTRPGRIFLSEPTFLTILQGVAVVGAGLGLTAWISSRHGRKLRYLVPAFALVAVVAVAVMTLSPFRGAAYRPTAQEEIDRLLESGTATTTLVPAGFHVGTMSNRSERSKLSANHSLSPSLSGFPDTMETRWETLRHTWEVDGLPVQSRAASPDTLGRNYVAPDDVPVSWALARAIEDHLGAKVIFRLGPNSNWNHSRHFSTPSYEFAPDSSVAGKLARVRADLAGDVFTWKVVADLPLKAGSSSKRGASTWQLARTVANNFQLRLQLMEETLSLQTGGDPNLRPERGHWRTRNRFVIHHPEKGTAWFGSAGYERMVPTVSAARLYYGDIEFDESDQSGNSAVPLEELAGARLLILQSEYLGRFIEEWESPLYTLDATPSGSNSSPFDPSDQLSPAEFFLWFDRLEKVPPEADPSRVQRHLDELFGQADRVSRQFQNPRDPIVLYVARFVPGHLSYLLTKLPQLSYRSANLLLDAITQGALEEQRHQIVEALFDQVQLSTVLDQRGWEQDAHETYISMVREGRIDGSRFLSHLLGEADPSLDALVLSRYRLNPEVRTYEILRTIPRLAPEAERITSELWKPGRIVIDRSNYQGRFQFGLLQGRQEALEELITVTRLLQKDRFGSQYALAQIIANTIHVPKHARAQGHDPEKILAWILQHNASDFAFDPILRRFALKAAHTTI